MSENNLTYNGGENFDLRKGLLSGKRKNLKLRTNQFESFINDLNSKNELQYLRIISSGADREVIVFDRCSGITKKMLMFG